MEFALLKEDVGFVEKEQGAPTVGDVDDLGEVFLQVATFDAEFANRDHVEGLFEEFRDAFCCEGFAGARGAMQDGDEALTFA